MKKPRNRSSSKLKLVTLSLLISCAATWTTPYASADIKPSVQSDAARLAAANEEIKYLTAKVATLEKLTAQGKELIAALDEQVALQQRTITALKSVSSIDDKILASYQASVDDAKKEIARWQAKAGFWKRIAGFGMVTVLVIGAAVGYVIGNK